MDVAALINSEIIKGALFSESGTTSVERLRKSVEEIQARYYELALGIQNGHELDPENLSFLENAAYYLVSMITRRNANFGEEDASAALGVSGLIFELLGRVCAQDRRANYFVNAALADSLAGYQSNSTVILWDIIGNPRLESYSLKTKYAEDKNKLDIAYLTILTFLARGLGAIVRESAWLYEQLTMKENQLGIALKEGSVHTTHYYKAVAYQRLAQAAVKTAKYMLSGQENEEQAAAELAKSALSLALESKDADTYWISSLFTRARDNMARNSIWRLLRDLVPESYIQILARAPQPVVELWPSQVCALTVRDESRTQIEGGFLNDNFKRVFISMPTNSGKSLLAELAIVKELFREGRNGCSCIYVVPSRSLVSEVLERLSDRLFDLGVAVKQVASGYDADPFGLMVFSGISRCVFVMTQEKLSLLLHQNSAVVNDCPLFVFDEVHNISEGARGWTLESVLSWLSNLKSETRQSKMLYMSAAIEASDEFVDWLTDNRQIEHLVVSTGWRPTRQVWSLCHFPRPGPYSAWHAVESTSDTREWEAFGKLTYVDASQSETEFKTRSIERVVHTRQVVRWSSAERKYKLQKQESTNLENHAAQLAAKLSRLGPVLVYFPRVDSLSTFANELSTICETLPNTAIPQEVLDFLKARLHPDYALCKWLGKGIAYHHGRLPLDVRGELERQYREGHIPVLASTTTLAEGVNLPARSLLIAGTSFGVWSEEELSVQKFQNMLGRAGRALRETEGIAVFLEAPLLFSAYGDWRRYFFPPPEELYPKCFLQQWQEGEYQAFFRLLRKLDEATDLQPMTEDQVEGLTKPNREKIADSARRIQAFLLAIEASHQLGSEDSELEESLNAVLAKTYTGRVISPDAVEDLRRYSCKSTRLTRAQLEPHVLELAGKTGLTPYSSEILLKAADELIHNMQGNWPTNKAELAKVLLESVIGANVPEAKPPVIRHGLGNSKPIEIDHVETALVWTFGDSGVRELADRFFEQVSDLDMRIDRTLRYIEEMFEYRLPWVLSSFQSFLVDRNDGAEEGFLNDEVKFQLVILPALVRFGVDSVPAALFSSLGISSARAAKFLGGKFLEAVPGGERDFGQMYNWLMEQNGLDIEGDSTVTGLELKRAFTQISRLQMRTVQLLLSGSLRCHVAGWRYYQGEGVINQLRPGTELYLSPDPRNEYDSNAVAIYYGKHHLGYVPARISREIKSELFRRKLSCTVIQIDRALPPWERVEIEVTAK